MLVTAPAEPPHQPLPSFATSLEPRSWWMVQMQTHPSANEGREQAALFTRAYLETFLL